MPFCKACGGELGDPETELHDPNNHYEIVEDGVSNPDSAHIKVVEGSKGPRMNCTREDSFTKIVNEPPQPEGGGSGGSEGQPKSSDPKPAPKSEKVYDLPEEKSAMDILHEVASTPVFELNDAQVQELMSWGEIYDGQIPPDQVEAILSNFSGVSKQTASLIRQKYEAKLNRWMQKRARDSGGPQIGAGRTTPMPQPPSGGGSPPSNNGGSDESESNPPPRPDPSSGSSDDNMPSDPLEMSKKRRNKRQSRRQQMMDEALDEFAHAAAQNMAGEVGKGFTQMRDIFFTLIKNKAKKDPDWFFEKMEEWDMDIVDEFFSMSEARQEELKGGEAGGFNVDMDIDQALDDTLAEDGSSAPVADGHTEPAGAPDSETTKGHTPLSDDDHPMTATPEDNELEEDEAVTEEDQAFEELMGDVAE